MRSVNPWWLRIWENLTFDPDLHGGSELKHFPFSFPLSFFFYAMQQFTHFCFTLAKDAPFFFGARSVDYEIIINHSSALSRLVRFWFWGLIAFTFGWWFILSYLLSCYHPVLDALRVFRARYSFETAITGKGDCYILWKEEERDKLKHRMGEFSFPGSCLQIMYMLWFADPIFRTQ